VKKSLAIFLASIVTLTLINSALGLSQAQIEAETYLWDFGQVRNDQTLEKTIIIRNVGAASLEVKTVFTSCGCVQAEIVPKNIAPREQAELKIIYSPQGQPEGPDSKDIYIFSNDPENPQVKISIQAEVIKYNSEIGG